MDGWLADDDDDDDDNDDDADDDDDDNDGDDGECNKPRACSSSKSTKRSLYLTHFGALGPTTKSFSNNEFQGFFYS